MKTGIATQQNLFEQRLQETGHHSELRALGIDTVQVNIGLACNLECGHCHVSSSPRRKEQMGWETMEQVLHAAKRVRATLVDITGGAPEMNPNFRRFVTGLRQEGLRVMVRTNLTIMLEPGYTDLPEFFRDRQIHLIASLPCYLEENVDKQRGAGVYRGSIEILQKLNLLGYGIQPELALDLIYNPLGPSLPPKQDALEADYRRMLGARFGISFTRLYTITNMAIGQFRADLQHQHKLDHYQQMLRASFNPLAVDALMCRNQISVRWDGILFDCDFNLALGLRVCEGLPAHISQLDLDALARRRIAIGEHCFGCTAGCGSSCGGALIKGS